MLYNIHKIILKIILVLLAASAVHPGSSSCLADSGQGNKKVITGLQDLDGQTIGVYSGTIHDQYVAQTYPDAHVNHYDTVADMVLGISTGKVDAAFMDLVLAKLIVKKNRQLVLLADDILDMDLGVGFRKDDKARREDFNEFLAEIRNNGIYDEMVKRWFMEDPETAVMPEIPLPTEGLVLRAAVSVEDLPYVIFKDNKFMGFDIEMIQRFAASRGYRLKMLEMNYASLVPALASGKADLISDGIAISEERKKKVDFSNPYARLRTGVIVRKDRIAASEGYDGTVMDLNGLNVGILEGSIYDAYVAEHYPDAVRRNYVNFPDMLLAAMSGKVNVFLYDNLAAKAIDSSKTGLGVLAVVPDMDQKIVAGFSKDKPELRERFNEFLAGIRENGIYDDMAERWFTGSYGAIAMPDIPIPEDGPVLTMGTDVVDLPFVAFSEGKLVGWDLEMMQRFAAANGYILKVVLTNFGSLIPALTTGKVDVIAAGMAYTDERAKKVDFSDVYTQNKTVIIGKTAVNSAEKNVDDKAAKEVQPGNFSRLRDSFYSNIIHEKRYLLIVEGLKTTFIISIWSVLIGTLLGGVVTYMNMHRSAWMKIPAAVFIAVVRGTPILVILMITFYVIFGSVDIDPVLVSIFAFGMNFAAYVSEMYRTGIESVENGQTEAGLALGFTAFGSFLHIVAPQAIRRILPVYKGEVISLVKMTSIVGYIAVQDLTKAGDIIRSRTFDAFFPLIMVAFLYFLISYALLTFLNRVEKRVEPKPKTYRRD